MSKSPFFSTDLISALAGDALRKAKGIIAPRKVVTLHHLACSGGTIITKAIAAMPGTMVLSEIHPDRAAQPAFHAHTQIRKGYEEELSRAHRGAMRGHFIREMVIAHAIAKSLGKTLVIRDHAHVDFAWRKDNHSMLIEQLHGQFEVTPIVTVRDPREVWLSAKHEGWFDGTVDELCRAHCNLLEAFEGAAVFAYEDFTQDPDACVRSMCDAAGIEFDPSFQSRLDDVQHLTGDSGRKSGVIAPRPAKPLTKKDQAAFDTSAAYAEFQHKISAIKGRNNV